MTNVEKYQDAVRERDALDRAIRDEGLTPERRRLRADADARVRNAYGKLTGGDLGRMRRQATSPVAEGDGHV